MTNSAGTTTISQLVFLNDTGTCVLSATCYPAPAANPVMPAQYTGSVVTPVALSIAGSDPSGGAGLQADLKTFHRIGVYGEAVVTLITVQNTRGVRRVDVLAAELVAEQIHAVITDIPPKAAKTGALGSLAVMEAW